MLLALLLFAANQTSLPGQTAEVVAELRVHGNHTTPTEEVLALSGLQPGQRADSGTLTAAAEALRSTRRFAGIELRKRFRSIADPSSIVVIIVVDELPSVSRDTTIPGPIARILGAGMFLPVIRHDEGYGFTYGARFSFVGLLGPASRVSVPLTWGGTRQATVEGEWSPARGPVTRVAAAVGVARRVNPFYRIEDTRQDVRFGAERVVRPWLRVRGGLETARVAFGVQDEKQWTTAAELVVDTRRDPLFPRNAVHAVTGWRQLRVQGETISRLSSSLGGYLGVVGSTVAAVRTSFEHASAPLPAWEQPLLGGSSTVRGYRVGSRVGDQIATGSAELRVPLTSPLGVGRFGVKAFVDVGTTWAHGERASATRWDRGVGAGVFATAAVVSANIDVAWPERGSARWHVGLGVKLPRRRGMTGGSLKTRLYSSKARHACSSCRAGRESA